MIKKSLGILSVSAMFFVQAQDISVLRNSIEVYGNQSINGTSKFNAMAGAMGALGGDVSVLNTNPAGIGVAIAGDLSATLNITNSKNSATLYNNNFGYSTKSTDLGQVGGVAVFEIAKNSRWKFVNLGFNYSTHSVEDYVESRNATGNIGFDLDNGDRLNFQRHAYDRTGSVSKMNLGLGANYDNRIYVGAGINLSTSSIDQVDRAQLNFTSTGNSEFFNKQYTPFYEDATGFSASVGVIGKIGSQFRAGLAIETPTWWNIERIYNHYDANTGNDGEYSESRKLSSPMKTTLSAAYVPNKSFAINVDYTLGLSQPKFTGMDTSAQTEINTFYTDNYQKLSEVRIGAEYRLQQFRVRGGYAYTNSPFNTVSIDSFDSQGSRVASQRYDNYILGDKSTIGFGLGYDFRAFYIDATYNHISSQYQNPFLRGSESANTQYYSSSAFFANDVAAVSSVKNKKNNVTVTLGWKF